MCVCVRAGAHMCVCVRVCVRARACVCVRVKIHFEGVHQVVIPLCAVMNEHILCVAVSSSSRHNRTRGSCSSSE